MSSRIVAPGDQGEVSLPSWREAAPTAATPAASKAPPKPDCAEQIARIQQQCEQRVADARAAGARDGEALGRSRAAAELQPVIDRVARSIEELAQFRPKMRREAEADMIRLSMAIAGRILRREISIDADAMHGLVLGALEKLQSQEIHRVRVHPSHVGPVTACLRQAAPGTAIEVLGDPSRQIGDFLFETTRGNLDASVESQLKEIEHGLTDRLNRRS